VDVIVVYRIDRLSRSRMISPNWRGVDRNNVTFVRCDAGVQHCYLYGPAHAKHFASFAQFEREVIASASATSLQPPKERESGWWMAPLGYDVRDRKL